MMDLFANTNWPLLGCDPELFAVRQAGKVSKRIAAVPSTLILAEGKVVGPSSSYGAYSYLTRDGVQIELHAGGVSGCRQSLGVYLRETFRVLDATVKTARHTLKDPSITASFQPMVTLSSRDMAKLPPDARELNCKPSLNAYGREAILRDGSTYPIRTASGHLHLGSRLFQAGHIDMDKAVQLFDLWVGVPCVLVDQDPSQAIRRETYGRAGEYRLPPHGLEYRVPGNFWLKDYRLMSFVFALAKQATAICEALIPAKSTLRPCINSKRIYEMLMGKVDLTEVERVINTNDFNGAWKIYTESILPVTRQITTVQGLYSATADNFEYFVDQIHAKASASGGGLRAWFYLDDIEVLQRWLAHQTYTVGWETFLIDEVGDRRARKKFTGIVLDPQKDVARTPAPVIATRRSRTADRSLPLAA